MAARNIFQTTPHRRQVLGSDMMYGPDKTEAGPGEWLPPDATINRNGTITLPAKYVNPAGTPIPGEKLNPDGSLTIPDPYAKPSTVAVGPSVPVAPVTPPAAPVVKKADMSAYLIPLALLGATALGGYLLLRKRGRR